MKKHSISLVLFVSFISIAAPLYSLGGRRTSDTTTDKTTSARKNGAQAQKLDRVHFWNAIVKALKKDGYATDSVEVQHAQRYLQRAQARQEGSIKENTTKAARAARKNDTSSAPEHRTRKHTNQQTRQQPL